jgi:ubiquitin
MQVTTPPEVEIEITDAEDGWAPYIILDDALKLDQVREALKSGDVAAASTYAKKVYALLVMEPKF